MIEGNQGYIPIYISDNSGKDINIDDVEQGIIKIANLQKIYNKTEDSEITYDIDKKAFLFPITQEETISMPEYVTWEAKFKFIDGSIDGVAPLQLKWRQMKNETLFN